MTTTDINTSPNRSPRLLKAMERVAVVAALDGKSQAREEAAQLKAVRMGLDTYLARAPLGDRRTLLETIAQLVGERSANRIRAYAARMTEAPPPAPVAETAALPVEAAPATKQGKEGDKTA